MKTLIVISYFLCCSCATAQVIDNRISELFMGICESQELVKRIFSHNDSLEYNYTLIFINKEFLKFASNSYDLQQLIIANLGDMHKFVDHNSRMVYLTNNPLTTRISTGWQLNTIYVPVKLTLTSKISEVILKRTSISLKKVSGFNYAKIRIKLRWIGNKWIVANVKESQSKFVRVID